MMKELSKEEIQERIAKRVALELPNNSLVNLGIGLPTKVARFLPEGVTIMLQSENGFVGLDKVGDDIDPTIVNAGGQPVGIVPGGAFLTVPLHLVSFVVATSMQQFLALCKLMKKETSQTILFQGKWFQEWAVPWIY